MREPLQQDGGGMQHEVGARVVAESEVVQAGVVLRSKRAPGVGGVDERRQVVAQDVGVLLHSAHAHARGHTRRTLHEAHTPRVCLKMIPLGDMHRPGHKGMGQGGETECKYVATPGFFVYHFGKCSISPG